MDIVKCSDCVAYVTEKQHCHRYPAVVDKLPGDFCLEGIKNAVKEREIEENNILEYKRADGFRPSTETSGGNSLNQGKKEEKVTRKRR